MGKAYLKYCNIFDAIFLTNEDGSTPLHSAAKSGKPHILEWILQQGRDVVDATDFESGWTALHKAFHYGRISCIAALLRNGANINIQDSSKSDVIDFFLKDVAPWCSNLQNKSMMLEIADRNDWDVLKSTHLSSENSSELYAWGNNENLT